MADVAKAPHGADEGRDAHATTFPGPAGPRNTRCGTCAGCVRTDCGRCMNCLDKRCNGGPGIKKQACVRRACINLQHAKPAAPPPRASAPPPPPPRSAPAPPPRSTPATATALAAEQAAAPASEGAAPVDSALHEVLESLFMLNKHPSSSDARSSEITEAARRALGTAPGSPASAAAAAARARARMQRAPAEPESGGRGSTSKLARCGTCPGCLVTDCGACKNCQDKPKYGGPGVKKQACIGRKCSRPRPVDGAADGEEARGEGPGGAAPPRELPPPSAPSPLRGAPRHPSALPLRRSPWEHGSAPEPMAVEAAPAVESAELPRADERAGRHDEHPDSASTTTSTHYTPAGGGARGSTPQLTPSKPPLHPLPSAAVPTGGARLDGAFGAGEAQGGIEPSSLAILSFVTAQAAAAAAAADAAKAAAAAAADACHQARTTMRGEAAAMAPPAQPPATSARAGAAAASAAVAHSPGGPPLPGWPATPSVAGKRRGSHSQSREDDRDDEDAPATLQRSPHRRHVSAGDRSPHHSGGGMEDAPGGASGTASLGVAPRTFAKGGARRAACAGADADGAAARALSPSHTPPPQRRKRGAARSAGGPTRGVAKPASGTGGGGARSFGRRLLPGGPSSSALDPEALQRLARRPFKLDKERRRAGSNPGYYAALLARGGSRARAAAEPPELTAVTPGARARKRPRAGAADAAVSPLERGLGVLYGRLQLQPPHPPRAPPETDALAAAQLATAPAQVTGTS